MGSILSRRIAGVEDIDIQANSAYRFPPKSGNYFASHFFMGGEKFDTPHPEGYLFGENMDLNFLGNRPVQFPYITPAPHEPVKTLRSLVNIRKDSLRLVRYKDDADSPTEEGGKPRVLYGVEFTFDADARVAITIYCQAFEEFTNGMAIYSPKCPTMISETVHYKRGVSQQFSLPSFKIDFSEWKEEDLNFDLDRGVFPMVIQAVVDEGDDCLGHAHVLLAAFERHVDGSYSVKPLKQKQIVDRVSYLLQEIYGIENKNNQETKPSDDENSDNSNECVVCLSDLRDTLILPCRHLCLCNSCADTLRYQANNCPICRLPFRALLQIRAVRKKPGTLSPVSFSPVLAQTMDHDEHSSSDSVPPGFEPISLLEAMNGLRAVSPGIPSAPLYDEINFSSGTGGNGRQLTPTELPGDGALQKGKVSKSPDSSTLRSPSSPIQEEDEEKLSEMSDAQPHAILSSSPAPTEATAAEDPPESITPEDEEVLLSGAEILKDCSSEHSSLTKTESDPPGDLSLPGSSESTESLKSQSTNCSSQPLLCPQSSLHMEDEQIDH
ncbi:E3 ubiquitin-protein ligase MGRN1b isoform X1 [Denticeps clupeoides]|uniref:E3 ubiquitin-protein ligase MGRN1b isoform X1 n=1 Tax=Denticeps clupeoides TaxID=299321 RepID=UPI0010A2BE4A|nr:E3 ubiquitin-protein ligase MGRN1 isoform X1 [Denticeps clupeoides]XP_028841236.1 E3 ubiquitin-protein ligase MGRN1 isoform X1 [Denticeps clupeoides]XP_028841237.1 E3 ubiquitin-protein ligase MGRN1 isoform X1 [Denticeps clupeoides]XP_028841238.1 E3 ubiquitin-protein ligase MGRN1 isoform X1 [Denticeps clupeoides]